VKFPQVGELNPQNYENNYKCQKCQDTGWITNGDTAYRCNCQWERQIKYLLSFSGLEDFVNDYTFEKYKASEKWQKHIFDTAKNFLDDCEGNWFFIGGQVGCGKTHICTAIVIELLRRVISCQYMLWRDESVKLKAAVNDYSQYEKMIDKFKKVRCLYIDDFLKVGGNGTVTQGDINLAFELLNYRKNKKLITLISTEKNIDDILDIDEAIGSRIVEMTGKKYCIEIAKDRSKNMRLRQK